MFLEKSKGAVSLSLLETVMILLGVQLFLVKKESQFSEAFCTHPPFKSGAYAIATRSTFTNTNLDMANKKKNKYSNSSDSKLQNESFNIDDIIFQGVQASENWDLFATPFLNHHDTTIIKSNLDNRADLKYYEVGSIPTSAYAMEMERTRIIISNPDLEIDTKQIEQEYCSMIKIDNIQSVINLPEATSKSKPWPQLFMRIGVDLDNVGEVVVEEQTGNGYLVVLPNVARQCIRLLPKELRGVGFTVEEVCIGDYLPYDGIHQDMELGVLDKRSLQYQ